MKIKTITCHEVYNHGASLQEYALLKYLEELGHTAEVIHYKPPYLSQHFNLWAISNPVYKRNLVFKIVYLILKLPRRVIALKRKKAFDVFSKRYIKTSKTKYTSNDELKKKLPEADAYICGSDQIWNSFFQNGKDPAFYLNFVPDDKLKISYAASFAIDEIQKDLVPFVKEKVGRINHVSVRETSGVKILKNLGISKTIQVMDPVFLLSLNYWKDTFVESLDDKFVFVYDFDSNPLIKEMALKLKKENGYEIYTVNKNITYADKNYYLEGPEKFLSLIYNSQYNLTNSFHAVAFSLIFEKQFLVFNRSEKINTRMRDLLELIGLPQFLVDTKCIKDHYKEEINYKMVDKKLREHIQFSKDFLSNALKKS